MDSANQFLGTERIGRLMRQYAVPCIISLLVGALYNIVDQIFIANSMPVSDILTFIITLFIIVKTYRDLNMQKGSEGMKNRAVN